jgi:hypothetical protein
MENNGVEILANGVLVPGITVFDDLEPKTHIFRIRGKDYIVKSASTGAATKFRNANAKAAKWDIDPSNPKKMKVTGFDGLSDAEPLLVQLCTFEVIKTTDGGTRHGPVARGWVDALPPEVTKAMFDKIKEMSPFLTGVDPVEANQVSPADDQNEWPEELLPKDLPGSITATSS